MFEDTPANPVGGNVPSNLPVGEPEDIFGATEPAETVPAPPLASREEPADAAQPAAVAPSPVVETEPRPPTALAAGVLRPKFEAPASPLAADQPKAGMFEGTAPIGPGLSPVPAASVSGTPAGPSRPARAEAGAPPPNEMAPEKGPSISRGIMAAVITGVVLLIVGGGGWWIYSSFIRSGGQEVFEPAPAPAFEEPAPTAAAPAEEASVAPEVTREAAEAAILFGESVDADADQLDDDLERTIGTDPNNWDTDGDGLSDGDEELVWQTDPLNPDTDGDSYLDGEEVKGGYSPTGPGRLFEPPTTTE